MADRTTNCITWLQRNLARQPEFLAHGLWTQYPRVEMSWVLQTHLDPAQWKANKLKSMYSGPENADGDFGCNSLPGRQPSSPTSSCKQKASRPSSAAPHHFGIAAASASISVFCITGSCMSTSLRCKLHFPKPPDSFRSESLALVGSTRGKLCQTEACHRQAS